MHKTIPLKEFFGFYPEGHEMSGQFDHLLKYSGFATLHQFYYANRRKLKRRKRLSMRAYYTSTQPDFPWYVAYRVHLKSCVHLSSLLSSGDYHKAGFPMVSTSTESPMIPFRELTRYKIRKKIEIRDWIKETGVGPHVHVTRDRMMVFECKRDAMLFKLAFK